MIHIARQALTAGCRWRSNKKVLAKKHTGKNSFYPLKSHSRDEEVKDDEVRQAQVPGVFEYFR
jgi:hypothetical protein